MKVSYYRKIKGAGIIKDTSHPTDCNCESCGTLYILALTEYEIQRLLENYDSLSDTGDWYNQILFKLQAATK